MCVSRKDCKVKHRVSKWLCACRKVWTDCEIHFKEGLTCKATKREGSTKKKISSGAPRRVGIIDTLGIPHMLPKQNMLDKVRKAIRANPTPTRKRKARAAPNIYVYIYIYRYKYINIPKLPINRTSGLYYGRRCSFRHTILTWALESLI